MAGGQSIYLANALGGLAFGAVAYSRPATIYLEPYETTNPNSAGVGGDVPDLGYTARLAVTNDATNFPAASGGVKSLGVAQRIYTSSGVESIVGVGAWDAASGGNFLGLFVPAAPVATASGKRLVASTMTLTWTGAFQAALANALLDHAFGGGNYSALATLYVGAIASGTTEITGTGYARAAVTNNTTNFPTWSAGASSNGDYIAIGPATAGDWTIANRAGVYSALSGGTLLAVADLSAAASVANGEYLVFDPGQLDVSLAPSF